MLKNILLFCFCVFHTSIIYSSEYDIIGIYLSPDGDAKIEISKIDQLFFGKIVWLKNTDKNKDIHNPDINLRDKNLIGLTILQHFSQTETHLWENGTIYDPKIGKTYKCKMWFEEGNNKELFLRGFIGFSFLGRSEKFTRI